MDEFHHEHAVSMVQDKMVTQASSFAEYNNGSIESNNRRIGRRITKRFYVFFRLPLLVASTLSLACAQENLQLEKIDVEAQFSLIEERKENSIAKRIIRGEELAQYGDLNALEILKRTPGVTVPEGKKKKGAPGKGYTKVLIDGEEVTATKRGNPLEQISPEMIERLEVMTNGSAEYTAEAMGGIVNIVLKKPASEGKTTAKLSGGVYNSQPMGSVFAQREGKNGPLSYMLNATYADNSHKDDASRHIDEGTVSEELTDSEGRLRSLTLSTKLIYAADSKTKYGFDASMGAMENRNTSDESTYTAGTLSGVIRNRDESDAMMLWTKLSGSHHLSGTELAEWKLKFHQNDSDGESRSFGSGNDQLQYDDSFFRMVGGEGSYSRALGDHFVKTGVEFKRLSQKEDVRVVQNGVETSSYTQSLREDKGSWYLQDEISVGENAIVTPGLRYEKVSRDFGASSRLDYFAPSLHVLYRLGENDNLRASVARTVKLPRLSELSPALDSSLELNDLNHPDVTGNPDLKEEEALGYELRYEHFFEDKGIAGIGGFYRSIDDKIEKMTTLDSGTGRYLERPENAGEGRLWGIELEMKKSLNAYLEGVGVFANATFQNSSLETNGYKRTIKATSDYLCNLGIDHTLSTYRLTWGAAYRYVGGYDDPVDENGIAESQKGYGTLDLYVTKRLSPVFKAGVNLKNLTGTTIETTTRRYDSGVLTLIQTDRENSEPHILLTLEGRW